MGIENGENVTGTWRKNNTPWHERNPDTAFNEDALAEARLGEDPNFTYRDENENLAIAEGLEDDSVKPLDFDAMSFGDTDFTPEW